MRGGKRKRKEKKERKKERKGKKEREKEINFHFEKQQEASALANYFSDCFLKTFEIFICSKSTILLTFRIRLKRLRFFLRIFHFF